MLSATAVLEQLLRYYSPGSMVDFGCGVGTWLNVAERLGVAEVYGMEGEWLDKAHLVIDQDGFRHADLSKPVELHKRFELAISLEVAEHIADAYADTFVHNLTKAADVVMFSAAIPGQRGSGHINEQWPEYWIEKFAKHGYLPLDIIRPYIWHLPKVKGWYKQNILVYVKSSLLDSLPALKAAYDAQYTMYNLVHPDTYLRQIELSHPRNASFSKVIKSLPILTVEAISRNTKKIFRKVTG